MAPSDGNRRLRIILQLFFVLGLVYVVSGNSTCLLPSGEIVPVGTRNYITSSCTQKCHCVSENVAICDDNPCSKDETCRQGADGRCSCIDGYTGDGEYCVRDPVSLTKLGCYREVRPLRHFSVHVSGTDPERSHPVSCMKACANQKLSYAAMADGRYCFCAETLPDVVLLENDDAKCDTPCTNPVFSGYPCGGATHVSVYQAPIRVDAVLLTLSNPANAVQRTFDPVSVSVHVTTDAQHYKMAVDFGDNSGEDENLVKIYSSPGKYRITATASDESGLTQQQRHGKAVLIQAPPRRVHVVCDEVVPAEEAFVCNVTVWQGSNMRIHIDWSDQITDNFPISDPVWSSAGSGARQMFVEHKPPLFNLSQGQHILIADSKQMFTSSGYITVVEYYVTALGDFTIQVERPSCSYCRYGDTCGATCDTPKIVSCSGQVYCPHRDTCVGQCDVTSADHPDSFTVIDQRSVTLTQLGWGYTEFDYGDLRVEAGDRIGFVLTGSGRIAMRRPSPGEQADKLCGETATCSGGYTDTGVKFMLRASSAEPTRVVLYHTYAAAGLYPVVVNASAEYLPADNDGNSTEILVQEKITDIVLISPEYNKTNSEVFFTLEPHKGSDLTYEWHFGDNNITNTTTPQIWHQFNSYGEYNVSVRVFNLIDEVTNWTTIMIEDELLDLNVSSSTSVVGEEAVFYISLSSGSHYWCLCDWQDGSPALVIYWTPGSKTQTHTFGHVFTRDLVYPVNITCRNNVSSANDVINQTVQYEIYDIHLAPYSTGSIRGTPFNFSYMLTNGTDPSCDVIFDGELVPNTYDVGTKTGWTPPGYLIRNATGFYLVNIRCFNLVSSASYVANFTVDAPIIDPKSSTNATIVVREGVVAFDLTMKDGTSVVVVWNFGRNSSADPASWTAGYQLAQLENWPRTVGADGSETPATHEVTHYYSNPGVYNATVVVKNNYNRTVFSHVVYVVNEVRDLRVMSNSPVGYVNGRGLVSVGFYTADVPPVLASVDVLWGDGSDPENGLDFTDDLWPLTQFGPHAYERLGAYEVWLNVSNMISWENYTTTVYVILPITNFRMAVQSPYVAAGDHVTLTASFEIGDRVTFDVDWGDGQTESIPRTGTLFVDIDTLTHSYVTSGVKLITVKAWNAVGSVTKMFTVMCQHPVTDMFTLQSTAPHQYPDGLVNFTLSYDKTQVFPTDAFVKFDFGDGALGGIDAVRYLSLDEIFTNSTVYSFSHKYSTAGDFILNVTISNNISEKVFQVMAGVYESINNIIWTSVYKPLFPLNSTWRSYDTLLQTVPDQIQKTLHLGQSSLLAAAFGDFSEDDLQTTAYKFGIDIQTDGTLSAVVIELRSKDDVAVFYSGNHYPAFEQGDKDTTKVLYTSSGYPVLRHDPDTEPHAVVDNVGEPVVIWTDRPGDYSVTVIISNPLGELRESFTLKLHATFGGLSVEPPPTVLPGVEHVFNISFTELNPEGCVLISFGDGTASSYGTESDCKVNGVDVEMAPVVDVISARLQPKHTYDEPGRYSQIVTAYSPTYIATATSSVVVSTYSCQTPKLRLLPKPASFLDPIQIRKSDTVQLHAETDIDCDDPSNAKLWTIVVVDENTGDELAEVDLSELRSRYGSELSVRPRFLDYGLYKISYNVTMLANPWFSATVNTYVRIVKSALIVSLAPGLDASITRGWYSTITLEPERYSTDPDDPANAQPFDSFTWFCRQQYETLTFDPVLGAYADADRSAVLEYEGVAYDSERNVTLPNRGGCFRQGPGLIANEDGTIYHNGSLSFSGLNLFKTETYRVVVVAQKDTRTAIGGLNINIVEGDPPQLAINCIVPRLCTWNGEGAVVINPSSHLRIALECRGSGIVGCGDLDIMWLMLYAGPHGSWHLAPTFNESSIIINSSMIVISKDFFSNAFQIYNEMTTFKLVARARRKFGDDVAGCSELLIHVNKPIVVGSCDITSVPSMPQNQRRINCHDFYHESGIDKYRAYAKYPDEDGTIFLQYSRQGSFVVSLPPGRRSSNFTVELWLEIVDNNGGFIRILVANETSSPAFDDELSSTDDVIRKVALLAADANIDQLTIFYASLSARLNGQAELSVTEYDCATAARYMSGGYTKSRQSTYNQSFNESENGQCNRDYEKGRNTRSKLRDGMISGMTNLTIASLDELQLISSTLAQVLAEPAETSRQSQESVAEYFAEMTEALDIFADTTPVEEISPTLSPLVSIVGSVLMSANSLWQFPLESDIASARQSQYYYYDTFYASDRIRLVDYDFDEAEEALEFETNEIVQREHSSDKTVGSLLSNLDELSSIILRGTNPGEAALLTQTDWLGLKIQKDAARALTGVRQVVEDVSVHIPEYCRLVNDTPDCDPDEEVVSVQMAVSPINVYGFLKDKPPAVSPHTRSSSLMLSLYNADNSPLPVENSGETFAINLPVKLPMADVPRAVRVEAIMSASSERVDLFYHAVNVTNRVGSLNIEVVPEAADVQLAVYVRYRRFPGVRLGEWDVFGVVPRKMSRLGFKANYSEDRWLKDMYTVTVSTEVFGGRTGKWIVGIRQLDEEDHDKYDADNPLTTVAPLTGRLTTNYSLRSWTATCAYMDSTSWHQRGDSQPEWLSDGLTVGENTTYLTTQCLSNHLSMFSGGWAVKPNPIDFNYVFSHMDFAKNPTIYTAQIIILLGYILTAIWARRKDRKDIERLGVTPLPDNLPDEKYYYLLSVQTGIRKEAGTKSKIFCILAGDFGETDVRVLEDPKRPVFKRGSLDTFLMTTARPLGKLSYLRIWHDNSGKGQYGSWFLNYVIVHDLQTKEHFYFIVNDWLAVDHSDGKVDRLVTVAGKKEMINLKNLIVNKAAQKLGDDHLWFSVIARPAESRFTRLQRLSCCLLLLYTTMLANAMYYEVLDSSDQKSNGISAGPFSFSVEQLFVGVVSMIVVFPVNFIVVLLFRKAALRTKPPSPCKQAIEENEANMRKKRDKSMADASPASPRHDPGVPDTTNAVSTDVTADDGRNSGQAVEDDKTKINNKTTSWPWWLRIVAWVVLWVATLLSAAFVTFYGISFGDEKSRKWITSMVVSFFTSVFLTQPIKVLLAAVLFSLIFKKAELVEEDPVEEPVRLEGDEEFLYPVPGMAEYQPKKRMITYKPPDEEVLAKARRQRERDKKMFDVLREIIFHVSFVFVLFVVSYHLRDPNAFLLRSNLVRTVSDLESGECSLGSCRFSKISSMEQFWNWLQYALGPAVRADKWYNGEPPIGQRGFMYDRVSRTMGYAVIRQLRVKEGQCRAVPRMQGRIHGCYPGYSMANEDEANYDVGWTTPSDNATEETLPPEYVYRTAESLNGWPYLAKYALYGGGGYVAELKGGQNEIKRYLAKLRDELWLDRRTRAVFVEFTVYNPNVNLFGVSTFLVEFTKSSCLEVGYRVEPMNLLPSAGGTNFFVLVAQVAFVVFIVSFVAKEARKMIRAKTAYFGDVWNYNELAIILLAVSSVVVYFYRMALTRAKTRLFRETHGDAYMKFQYVASWNELLLYTVGWLCFLATVKFLRLLRFNKNMGLLGSVIYASAKPLAWYSLMFAVWLMAFCHAFYLKYVESDENFSTFVSSLESLLLMLVGKIGNFHEMLGLSHVVGVSFFIAYVVVICYIMFEMFLAILGGAIDDVQSDARKRSNEFEIIEYMYTTFIRWSGLHGLIGKFGGEPKPEVGRRPAAGFQPEPELEELIEHLNEKVDKLMAHIITQLNCATFETAFLDQPSDDKKKMVKAMEDKAKKSLSEVIA